MILFFYGADSYRSFIKLQELKTKYIDASLGDTNLITLDAKTTKPGELTSQLFALPFLAKTRLVIIPDLLARGPKALHEKFLEITEKIPETTVVVLYESKVPDRRTSIFKKLVKISKAQEFKPLVGMQLNTWIDQFLGQYKASISPVARAELLARVGQNMWALATELAKLATAVLSNEEKLITPQIVNEMVTRVSEKQVFALTDAWVSGNNTQMLTALNQLISQGENEQLLIGLVASSLRTIYLICDAIENGATNPQQIANITGLKPFVVQKHMLAAKRMSKKSISKQLEVLSQLDAASKRGIISPGLGLELFLLRSINFDSLFPAYS